jgi:DNA-binding transcriptional LysR family regulator
VHAVSELAAHPHVRFSGIAQDAPLRLVSGDKTVDVKVNTVFRANTSEALLQALESGIGIGGMQLPLRPTLCSPAGWYRYYPPGDYPIAFSMRSILTPALSHRG